MESSHGRCGSATRLPAEPPARAAGTVPVAAAATRPAARDVYCTPTSLLRRTACIRPHANTVVAHATAAAALREPTDADAATRLPNGAVTAAEAAAAAVPHAWADCAFCRTRLPVDGGSRSQQPAPAARQPGLSRQFGHGRAPRGSPTGRPHVRRLGAERGPHSPPARAPQLDAACKPSCQTRGSNGTIARGAAAPHRSALE